MDVQKKPLRHSITYSRDGTRSFGDETGHQNVRWNRGNPANLPVSVEFANSARWYPGNYWQREKSRRFILEYVTAGSASMRQEDQSHEVGPERVMVFHFGCGSSFSPGAAGFLHKRGLCLNGTAIEQIVASGQLIGHDVIAPVNPQRIAFLFKSIYRELGERQEGFQQRISLMAYEVLVQLCMSVSGAQSEPVRKMISHIKETIVLPFNTGRVCAQSGCGLDTHAAVDRFRKETCLTPKQYYLREKIRLIKHYLKTSDLQINEIAVRLGFEHRSHMTRLFYQRTGLWPGEFRKRER